jgi:transcriptional regulator with XRE-family HTH domain
MSHLSDNIKKIRLIVALKQEAFAEQMGVTLGMEKSYEAGRANPDILYLNKLETISGKSTSELVNQRLPVDDLISNIARIRTANKVQKDKLFADEVINNILDAPQTEYQTTNKKIVGLSQFITGPDAVRIILALTESNKDMVAQNKTVVDTNAVIANTNAMLARKATGSDEADIQINEPAIIQGFLAIIGEIATRAGLYHSEAEATADLNRQLNERVSEVKIPVDSVVGEDKKRTA